VRDRERRRREVGGDAGEPPLRGVHDESRERRRRSDVVCVGVERVAWSVLAWIWVRLWRFAGFCLDEVVGRAEGQFP